MWRIMTSRSLVPAICGITRMVRQDRHERAAATAGVRSIPNRDICETMDPSPITKACANGGGIPQSDGRCRRRNARHGCRHRPGRALPACTSIEAVSKSTNWRTFAVTNGETVCNDALMRPAQAGTRQNQGGYCSQNLTLLVIAARADSKRTATKRAASSLTTTPARGLRGKRLTRTFGTAMGSALRGWLRQLCSPARARWLAVEQLAAGGTVRIRSRPARRHPEHGQPDLHPRRGRGRRFPAVIDVADVAYRWISARPSKAPSAHRDEQAADLSGAKLFHDQEPGVADGRTLALFDQRVVRPRYRLGHAG